MSNTCHTVRLTIPPQLRAMEKARNALDNLMRTHGVLPTTTGKLQIVLDELLSNIMHHGYGLDSGPEVSGRKASIASASSEVRVKMQLDNDCFTLTTSDDSAAFNPCLPAFANDAARPRLGGRGLDLVRALSDSLTYQRTHDRNVTVLIKTVALTTKEMDKMAPGLTIDETLSGQTANIALAGRIDSGNAPYITEHLGRIAKGGHIHLVLDLTALDYLTSAGFRTLLIVSDVAEDIGGSLTLTNLNAEVRDLFDLSGLSQAFHIQ